jgi:hypothetical protein
MYKHARGAYRVPGSERPREPRPPAYWRTYYYSAVAQDTKTRRRFRFHHMGAPDWLKDEVERFTPRKWLAYWDKKTGKPKGANASHAREKPSFVSGVKQPKRSGQLA